MRTGLLRALNASAFVIIALLTPCFVCASEYVAFSLNIAREQITDAGQDNWRSTRPDVYGLAGMTSIKGLIIDHTNNDVVIVGLRDKSRPGLTLDDLAVALRSRLVKGEWPLVSIDPTDETKATKMQKVRYEGGIDDTDFGKDMFDADLCLKKIDQGTQPSGDANVPSAFESRISQARAKRDYTQSEDILERYWFYPTLPSFQIRQDVAAFDGLKVSVFNQVMAASIDGKAIQKLDTFNDPIGDLFARRMSDHFDGVSAKNPAIARLPGLLELVALAHAIELMDSPPDVSYWLSEFKIHQVSTPKAQKVLSRKQEFPADNTVLSLTSEGGVHLTALALRLKSGDPQALRDAVLLVRPSKKALFWTFVTGGWLIPTTGNVRNEDALPLIAQALFLGDQKRFDDAMICLGRASEASPELNDEISICKATLVLEREFSSILKDVNQWVGEAYMIVNNPSSATMRSTQTQLSSAKPSDMNLLDAMHILVAAHTRKAEPYLLLASLQFGVGNYQKGKEIIDEGMPTVPDSGALHYFRAWCSLFGDDRSAAIADLTAAARLLKVDDPSDLTERTTNLLERVQLNAQGKNWSKFSEAHNRYTFEYPSDWRVFTPKEFRQFMVGLGVQLPNDIDAADGTFVVDPTRSITVSIEYRDVGQHVSRDQVRLLWDRLKNDPKRMESEYATILPGFRVRDINVAEVATGLRQEIRYEFPVQVLGEPGVVEGRKAGVYQDNIDSKVAVLECKAWSTQFDHVNSAYFERLISSFRLNP